MSKLQWYWHRLRVMEPSEIAAHVRKKFCQWSDEQELPDWSSISAQTGERPAFPSLPPADLAPLALREALQRDIRDILGGRWRAFGHLEIKVDDPPGWQTDYLIGKNLETDELAFHLDHRRLPGGADIKLIWELSRWHQLVRLAMAAHVLGAEHAARKCIEWLGHWASHNQPYRGWNWTSALEVGMRLVQFAWMDALLEGYPDVELKRLRAEILPAHVWFAWRYRSFGSSANNHRLGELAGLILAIARWPELARWAASLDESQRLWEREVLAQFAEDGGHREQALNYHLFSWEFCWQARAALAAAGREISGEVEERLRRAADFFVNVQVEGEAWDYGDSDNAFVTPFFLNAKNATAEWRDWFRHPASSPAIHYWWRQMENSRSDARGSPFTPAETSVGMQGGWRIYSESGFALSRSRNWTLRWDVSPLGYLSTAAHGHLDALHVSIWFRGAAMVIDPGTGAYYEDNNLRTYLASWEAHNGPHPVGLDFPKRLGPFLWAAHHAEPNLKPGADTSLSGELSLPSGLVKRTLVPQDRDLGWQVHDTFQPHGRGRYEFCVRWQFAPGAKLEKLTERRFRVGRNGVSIEIQVSVDWVEVRAVAEKDSSVLLSAAKSESEARSVGTVSSVFRKTEWGPLLKLVGGSSDKSCVFSTTFLACGDS